eukprot:scaffold335611_cov51-Attheya_sp.AAC.1
MVIFMCIKFKVHSPMYIFVAKKSILPYLNNVARMYSRRAGGNNVAHVGARARSSRRFYVANVPAHGIAVFCQSVSLSVRTASVRRRTASADKIQDGTFHNANSLHHLSPSLPSPLLPPPGLKTMVYTHLLRMCCYLSDS